MIVFYLYGRYIFKNKEKVGLQELGPRFTLKLRWLQKGAFDTKFGEYEWIHKVLSNTFNVSAFFKVIVIYKVFSDLWGKGVRCCLLG